MNKRDVAPPEEVRSGTIWKCPVCGFLAKDKDEQDAHMKETGHLIYDNIEEEKGKKPTPRVNDLNYSEHSGYTPGVSSGDVADPEADLENRDRVEKEKKKS